MTLTLHNPVSHAHIEDLKDRLTVQLALASSVSHEDRTHSVIRTLIQAVMAMDRGAISEADAREVFAAYRIPGFRFEQWLTEMVGEGVYLETGLLQAA